LARENVRANGALKHVTFRQLRWGVEEDIKPLENTSWDWILGADITYKEGSWGDIAKTISRLAEKKTKVLIISQRRGVDDIEKFLKTIQVRTSSIRNKIRRRRDHFFCRHSTVSSAINIQRPILRSFKSCSYVTDVWYLLTNTRRVFAPSFARNFRTTIWNA